MKSYLKCLLFIILLDKSKVEMVAEQLYTLAFWRKNWFRIIIAVGLTLAFCCLGYGCIFLLASYFSASHGLGMFLVKMSFGAVFLCFLGVMLRWFFGGVQSMGRWACVDSWHDYIKVICVVLLLGVVVLLLYAFLLRWKYPDLNQRGVFGDSFGALNAFIALCGFVGLWISITLQRHQMNAEHRREMRSKWPVCTLELNNGRLSLDGLGTGRRIRISIHFDMHTRNLSDMIVLNVINAIDTSRIEDGSNMRTSIYGEVMPLIDAKKVLTSSVMMNNRGSVAYSMEMLNSLLKDEESDSRKIDAIAYYTNVQGSYFKVSLGFHISLRDEVDRGTLQKWADSIQAMHSKLASELLVARGSIEIEKEFAKRGVKWGDSIVIGFDFRAGSFSIEEITCEEYAKVRESSIATHNEIA